MYPKSEKPDSKPSSLALVYVGYFLAFALEQIAILDELGALAPPDCSPFQRRRPRGRVPLCSSPFLPILRVHEDSGLPFEDLVLGPSAICMLGALGFDEGMEV